MKTIILFITSVFISVFSAVSMANPSVVFTPDKQKVVAGEVFTITIEMSGFPKTEGGGVSLEFNPKVIQVEMVNIDKALWGFKNQDGVIDNKSGNIKDILFINYIGISDSATVANIQFKAVKRGHSLLRLMESEISPFASGGERLEVEFGKSVVRVVSSGKRKNR